MQASQISCTESLGQTWCYRATAATTVLEGWQIAEELSTVLYQWRTAAVRYQRTEVITCTGMIGSICRLQPQITGVPAAIHHCTSPSVRPVTSQTAVLTPGMVKATAADTFLRMTKSADGILVVVKEVRSYGPVTGAYRWTTELQLHWIAWHTTNKRHANRTTNTSITGLLLIY